MQKGYRVQDLFDKIMHITGIQLIVALIFSGMAIAHDNHAQEILYREVSLEAKEVTFGELLDQIAAAAQVKFVYSPAHLKLAERVSVSFSKETLGKILDQLLTVRKLKYKVQQHGDFILIVPVKPEKKSTPREEASIAESSLLQSASISGKVLTTDGTSLPGVSVSVKGTTYGKFTDADGRYVIDARPDDVLAFSSIGYKPFEIQVGNATNIDVVMKDDVTTLSEVVVNASYSTGYQVLPKERATGSYSKPNMEIFKDRASTLDVVGRLEGQVAGLTLNTGPDNFKSNSNGNGKRFRSSLLRGKNSVYLESEPLFVLNGVPVTDYTDVNPDDIADITVLKDAAATAIWGARAANGVIVVTTKSGRKEAKLRVNYSAFVNFPGRMDYDYQHMMNSGQYIRAARETFDPVAYPSASLTYDYMAPHEKILYDQHNGLISSERANASLDSLASIDNLGQIKDIYRRAYTTNHTVSISGAGDIYSFYSSLSYANTHSEMPGDKENTYRLNFTQDFNPNKHIKLSLSTNLSKGTAREMNSFSVDRHFLPYQLFRDGGGNPVNLNYLSGWSEELRQDYQARSRVNLDYNPLNEWNARHSERDNVSLHLVGNAGIHLWKGLSFLGTYGYAIAPGQFTDYQDYTTFDMRSRLVRNTVAPTTSDVPVYHLPTSGGQYRKSANDQRDWTARNQLTYTATPRGDKDNLTVQAGYEARESFSTNAMTTLEGYDEALLTYPVLDYDRLRQGIPGTVTGWGGYYEQPYRTAESKRRFTSLFALVNYTIRQKYSVDVSWRRDHSNLFGSDKSSQNRPIWSVGGKWRASQETFMKSTTKWLNDLSVRATYGITGNSPYVGAATSQDVLTPPSPYPPGVSGPGLTISTNANRTLKWESTETINLGIDFALINSKITGSVNLYNKNTRDLLGNVELNPFTGKSKGLGNLGHLINRGIELDINSNNLTVNDFNWFTGVVFSYNKNEMKSYSAPEAYQRTDYGLLSAAYWVGYPIAPVFAYRWAGLDALGDPQIRLADNTITKERNVAADTDMEYMGTLNPVFNGGLSNTFRYKAWQLSVNMVYSLGHVMRKDVNTFYTGRVTASSGWSGNLSTSFEDRWKNPGDERATNVPSYVADQYVSYDRRNVDYYTRADINVVSASYAKVRDITLSYTLPSALLNRLRVESVRVYAQSTNFMLWKANNDDIDPEFHYLEYGTRGNRVGHGLILGINASF